MELYCKGETINIIYKEHTIHNMRNNLSGVICT